MSALVIFDETARIPPATPYIFRIPWCLPFPSPIEGDGGTIPSGEVADQLHVGVLVEVWVGMELSCDQIFDLSRSRSVDVGEAIDLRTRGGAIRLGALLRCLSDVEGEGKHKLVLAAQL